jgi:hypothetical protein
MPFKSFRHTTPVMRHIQCCIEVLMLIEVEPGGAFDKAGFEKGDVFANSDFPSINSFSCALNKPKGTAIEF